jgi:hypothetical protein
MRGAYIVKCGGSVFEGCLVQADSCSGVSTVGSMNIAQTNWQQGVAGTRHIGRALTPGIVGSYAIVYLNI